MTPLDAALAYAWRGWPVFPVRRDKHPFTAHGKDDATLDSTIIREWWHRWPIAMPAIVTGELSGIVALDIDIRPGGSGFDTLELLEIPFHPVAPTAHTPQGGCAVLFRWPGRFIKTCAGDLGPHLDIRGDRGSLILPPGPGRFWDPHIGSRNAHPANARMDDSGAPRALRARTRAAADTPSAAHRVRGGSA